MIIVSGVGGGGPSDPTPDAPRFSWGGLVNFLDITPEWYVIEDAALDTAQVNMAAATAAIDFSILVNGSSIDTVSATATASASYGITVPVVSGDRVKIELTNVGTGLCHDLSILLRQV